MGSAELVLATLGWCTLINIAMLIFASFAVVFFGAPIMRIHQKWFGLSEVDLQREYFRYLASYKMLTLVFNLVPYLALRLALP